jgi:hypothetical protein
MLFWTFSLMFGARYFAEKGMMRKSELMGKTTLARYCDEV